MPIPIEAALLAPRLKMSPPSPSALRFWQLNVPLQSSAVTLALQLLRYGVNLGLTMALARLLTPTDFGLFAMAVTFTGLLWLFKDGGLETTLVARGAVSEDERAALAGLTCGYGLLLAVICAALGPALARLYGEPRLSSALLLPASAFLFYGLDVLPSVELLRTHRFRLHAVIETIAASLGWSVALVLAWRGAGYWSLFAIEPVSAAALLLGHAWAVRWRPRFSRAWGTVRHLLHFSRDVGITRAFGFASRNVDNLVLGLVAGANGLAFYSKALRLISLPQDSINGPLTRIAIPLLSQLRDHPAEFVRAFRHFNLTSMALGLPCIAFLLIATPEIVAIVYGPQWTPVVPLIRWLGVLGLLSTFYYSTSWVFVAMGTVHRQLRWEALNLTVMAAAFLIGARWDTVGVAIAASAGCAVLRLPALLYCFRGTAVQLGDVTAVLWRPLLACTVGVGLVLLIRAAGARPDHVFAAVARDAVVLAVGYVTGWVLVPGWREFLRHELRRPASAA